MNRLVGFAFFVLLVASAAVIVATTAALPPNVASHFAGDGRPNGWQTPESYRTWMLGFGVLLPCVVVAPMAWLPRRFPRLVNLPHREHWLAPQRRDATLAALSGFAFAIGSLEILFTLGIHLIVVDANASAPPRMSSERFFVLMALFVAGLIALVVAYHRRFRTLR